MTRAWLACGARGGILAALVACGSTALFAATLSDEALDREWPRIAPASLDTEAWRQASPTRYAEVRADFDGDGTADQAVLRAGRTGQVEAVFVKLSGGPAGQWLQAAQVTHRDPSSRLLMGISVVQPGTYKTACAKGYGPECKPDEPRELQLQQAGIQFFRYESAASIIYWDAKAGELRQVWTSD